MLVGVGDGGGVEEAMERVLMLGARPVGDLDACAALLGILKEVDVRALIEAVMGRVVSFRPVEVVDVSEAVRVSMRKGGQEDGEGKTGETYSVATFSSPGRVAIVVNVKRGWVWEDRGKKGSN